MITSLSPAATISNCNIAHVFMVVNHLVFQFSPAIKKIIIIIIIIIPIMMRIKKNEKNVT